MTTRSAKAAERGQGIFSFDTTDSIPSRKRSAPSPDDLEEELERPSKTDYNQVRKALIIARWDARRKDAEIQEKMRELQEKDQIITDREYQLLKCSEVHDKIKEAQDEGRVPRRKEHGTGKRNEFVQSVPGEQVDRENEKVTGSIQEMSVRLRAAIHEFANKYFGGRLQQPSNTQLGAGWAHQYMQATTPGQETYMDYLRSRHRCPMIIEAFIWRFICGTIFNGAPWSGSEEMRRHVSGLQNILTKFHNSTSSEPARVRKYQQWKRQTTKLVLEIRKADTTHADFHLLHLERHFAKAVSEFITPFMRSSLVGHSEVLIQIIHQAVELDKVISRQLPRYTWGFSPGVIESPFNFSLDQEQVMQRYPGERNASNMTRGTQAKVYLVVAPGLRQRGVDNSPSASFEEEKWVLPMQITCVKPRRQHRFGSNHDGSDTTVE